MHWAKRILRTQQNLWHLTRGTKAEAFQSHLETLQDRLHSTNFDVEGTSLWKIRKLYELPAWVKVSKHPRL
eukprot:12926801-Prorocentrum_lima.AAC.1